MQAATAQRWLHELRPIRLVGRLAIPDHCAFPTNPKPENRGEVEGEILTIAPTQLSIYLVFVVVCVFTFYSLYGPEREHYEHIFALSLSSVRE